jgi:hypothetical protein
VFPIWNNLSIYEFDEHWGIGLMAVRKMKSVDDVDVEQLGEDAENLFAELVASVRIPEPLVVVPGKLVVNYPPTRQLNQLLMSVSVDGQMRAVFGDDYEVAEELFGSQPIEVWNKFMERYNQHMFGEKDAGK